MRLFTTTPKGEQILRSGVICSSFYAMFLECGLSVEETTKLYLKTIASEAREYERARAIIQRGERLDYEAYSRWKEFERINHAWFYTSLARTQKTPEKEYQGGNVIFEVEANEKLGIFALDAARRSSISEVRIVGPEPVLLKDSLRALHYPTSAKIEHLNALLSPRVPAIPYTPQ